jgi:hypothetical protein
MPNRELQGTHRHPERVSPRRVDQRTVYEAIMANFAAFGRGPL